MRRTRFRVDTFYPCSLRIQREPILVSARVGVQPPRQDVLRAYER